MAGMEWSQTWFPYVLYRSINSSPAITMRPSSDSSSYQPPLVYTVCICECTWVGDHDDDALGGVFYDLRDDVFEDVDVPLNQVQPALSLLLTNARSYHDDTRVRRHRVV